MIIVWGLIIWGIISLVKHFSGHSVNKNESAIDILKERYAKGEITREQFELMKKDIK
jgi:putative membrane protein